MSIFTKIWAWIKKAFTSIQADVVPVAITIVEGIKSIADSGILTDLASFLGGSVPKEVVTVIQAALPKILSDLLAVEGLPTNATAAQIKTFVDAVISSFASNTFQKNSQLYTTLGVQIYNLIETDINANPANPKLTFAEIVALIEQGYQDYLADQNPDTTN